MGGRTTSSIGLVIGAIFMIIIGYSLTLDVYKDYGSYTIYYYGRYYGGIVCMIVGVGLLLIGLSLPIMWPKETTTVKRKSLQLEEKKHLKSKNVNKPNHAQPSTSQTISSIALKIKRISMLSTYGKDALRILLMLAEIDGNEGYGFSTLSNECGLDGEKTKKTIDLLLNLGLVKKKTLRTQETYNIPYEFRKQVTEAINLLNLNGKSKG